VLAAATSPARAQTYYRARVWSTAPAVTSSYYLPPAYPYSRSFGTPGYVGPYTSLANNGAVIAPYSAFRPYNYHYRYDVAPVNPAMPTYYVPSPYINPR
jgi:hypothetical protein